MSVESWFTKNTFEKIFPYAATSIIYTHDSKPFWTYESFIESIRWMNIHKDKRFHNFCNNKNDAINKLELAAFLANTHQETGDPSLKTPYSWWPVTQQKTGPEYGPAGGLICIIEGCVPSISFLPVNTPNTTGTLVPLTQLSRNLICLDNKYNMYTNIANIHTSNQPGFGLGTGNPSFNPGLVAVSDDGTLYGNNPKGNNITSIKPTSALVKNLNDRKYSSMGVYCQYGGRGAIQLSYNFNYSTISLELFNDYRLAQYPNLIITTDRLRFNNKSEIYGFPGPNPNGNNQLPKIISDTTPPARMMAWITAISFWMLPRSGKKISCHECMINPQKYGITCVNLIVNNESGCKNGTWASNKLEYYKRICNILQVDFNKTIICPATNI